MGWREGGRVRKRKGKGRMNHPSWMIYLSPPSNEKILFRVGPTCLPCFGPGGRSVVKRKDPILYFDRDHWPTCPGCSSSAVRPLLRSRLHSGAVPQKANEASGPNARLLMKGWLPVALGPDPYL
jgi:hypothetical protein